MNTDTAEAQANQKNLRNKENEHRNQHHPALH